MEVDLAAPDEGMTVDLGPDAPRPALPAGQKPETVNLVSQYATHQQGEWLKNLGQEVVNDYHADCKARESYMQHRAKVFKHFVGMQEMMSHPFEGGTKPHIPIVTKAALRLFTRLYDQVVPAKGDIVKPVPTGFEDWGLVNSVDKHANWQLRYQMPEWVRTLKNTALDWVLGGSTFRHQFRDVALDRNRAEDVPIEDMVIPYTARSVDPEMGDVPRITRVLHLPRHAVEKLESKGWYVGARALFQEEPGEERTVDIGEASMERSPLKDVADEAGGVTAPQAGEKKFERDFLECHRWLQLPGEEDDRPVIVTTDLTTGKVVAIVVREDEDAADRARYEAEAAANAEQHAMAMQQYEAAMAQTMTEPPMPGAQDMSAPPAQPALEPPQPPPPPEPVKMVPINFFVHLGAIPNPHGFYHFGIGTLLVGHNELANELAAQHVGAARLSNTQSGFMSDDVPLAGDMEWKPGKFTRVKGMTATQLQNAFLPFKFNPPDASIMQFVLQVEKEADGVSSAPDVMSGEAQDRETAAGIKIRVSQALTAIMVLTRGFLDDLKYEIKHLARLNSVYLKDSEFFPVIDPEHKLPPQRGEIGRKHYLAAFDVTFTADARMSSRPERVDEATQIMSALMQLPPGMVPPPVMHAALTGFFKALDREDLARLMDEAVKAAQQGQEPQPMSQEDENAGFIKEEYHPALPDDDDNAHLTSMAIFESGPFAQQLSPTGKQMFERHKREHMAQLYTKTGGMPQQAGPGTPPGAAAAMAETTQEPLLGL